jgi:TP901 family phage tail tape measure protein
MAAPLNLGITIRANAGNLPATLDDARQRLGGVRQAGNHVNREFASMAKNWLAIAAGGLSFASIAREIGSFESKMIAVEALTQANTQEMAAMTTQARELGATTAFSAQEAAEAQGVLASAGLRANEILAATPQILQLASAGNLELARATEIAMGAIKGLGLDLSELAHVNDVLAKTAGDTQSSVAGLGDALTQVTPLARLSNIGIDELSATLGVLANNNIKGATAGDQFKSMLAKLSDVTKPTIDVLAKYGLTVDAINIASHGLSAVMHTLQNAHLSAADTFQLFGTEAAAVGSILSASASEVDQLTTALKASDGAAEALANTYNTGLFKAFDALKGVISEAALQLGDGEGGLKNALTAIITQATGVIAIYEGMGEQFIKANQFSEEQATNLHAVAQGLETVAGAAGGIAGVTAALWLANVAMIAFNATTRMNPLIAIAGLGAAAIGGVIGNIHAAKREHEAFMTSANTLEEQNLKVKQQIAKVAGLAAAPSPSRTAVAAARGELEILIKQREAIEAKTQAVNAATEAEKNKPKPKPIAPTVTPPTGANINNEHQKALRDAQKQAQDATQAIAAEIAALNDKNQKLKLSERAYFATTLAAKGMNDAQKALSLALWDSNKALAAQQVADDKAKSTLASLTDQYDRLTMSARAYFADSLKKDGIAPQQAAPILKQFDKVEAVKADHQQVDAARASLEQYNQSLETARANTKSLGDVSSAVFDGALGGVSALAGAFSNMVTAVNENADALAELGKRQKENNAFRSEKDASPEQIAKDAKFVADNKAKYAKQEAELTTKNNVIALSGVRQLAGATASMFAENSQARKSFHAIEMALGAVEIAMQVKELAIKGAAAVLEQGKGDPYTAFARIAAMAAVVAGILAAVGGTFSAAAGSSQPAATTPDTGTVLGDSAKPSESIDRTYQLLRDIHASEYRELRGINQGVANLAKGITDVVTRLFQAGGIQDISINTAKVRNYPVPTIVDPVGKYDPISNFLLTGLFGTTKKELVGGGLLTNPAAVQDLVNGGSLTANQYSTIKTTKKSWFSESTGFSEQLSGVDASVNAALTGVFSSLGASMLSMAKSFGGDLTDEIEQYVIPSLRIELKGLSGEEAAKKLNGVISAQLDKMTNAIFGPVISQYQQLGEGLFETATRLVAQAAIVKDALAQSGHGISGDAIAISDGLVQLAGGLKEFQSQFETYYDKFFTDAEKQARTQKQLTETLKDVNLVLPSTRQGYRGLMEALTLSNSADRERYALLLRLSGAADTYYKTLEDGQKNLIDSVKSAYDTAAGLLKGQVDAFRGLVSSLTGFRDQLKGGALSTAMPKEKYESAKSEFQRLAQLTRTGTDAQKQDAMGKLQGAAQSFLDNSKSFSPAHYGKDYTSVQKVLDSVISAAGIKADVAQAQLDQLTSQVTALGVLNTSVISVKDAVDALKLAMVELQKAKAADAAIVKENANKAAYTKQESARRAAYDAPIAARAGASATAGAAIQSAGAQRGLTNTSVHEFSVAANFNARSNSNTSGFETTASGGKAEQVKATLENGQFPRVRGLFAQVGRRIEDLVGGALPDIRLSLGKSASSYAFDSKRGSVQGDNIDALLRGFANDATDYLADRRADKTGASQIKAVNFSSLASGLSALTVLIANLKAPFTAHGYDSAKDYTKINGSHKTGLERVPFDGYVAELHQDERVLTAPEAAVYKGLRHVARDERQDDLRHYAKGGIAREASIFGEAGPEAAVPLPDGKSIPVVFFNEPKSPRVSALPTPVQARAKDTTDDDKRNTQAVVDAILLSIKATAAGQDELRKELRETRDTLDKVQRTLARTVS